jgi:hypothetical protein
LDRLATSPRPYSIIQDPHIVGKVILITLVQMLVDHLNVEPFVTSELYVAEVFVVYVAGRENRSRAPRVDVSYIQVLDKTFGRLLPFR